MSDAVKEIFEFAGKACGTIVKDLADISQPLTEAFRRGWRQAIADQPPPKRAPSSADQASDSA
jgi:hypothetical protein